MTQNKRGSKPVKRNAAIEYLINSGNWVKTSILASEVGLTRSGALVALRNIPKIQEKSVLINGKITSFWKLESNGCAMDLAKKHKKMGIWAQLFWSTRG